MSVAARCPAFPMRSRANAVLIPTRASYKVVGMSRSPLEQSSEHQNRAINREAGAGCDDLACRIEQEDELIQAAAALVSTTTQQPVSVLGWGFALGGGALLWGLILIAYIH